MLSTGHRGGGVLQLVEPLHAAKIIEHVVATQLVGHGNHVDWTGRRIQRPNCVKNVLVRRAVKVSDVQASFADDPNRVTRQQQRAEYRLLGLQVVGRHTTRAALRTWRPAARELSTLVLAVEIIAHVVSILAEQPCGELVAEPWELPVDKSRQPVDTCG